MSDSLRLHYLFDKYVSNACTPAELDEFWHLLNNLPENEALSDELKALWNKERTSIRTSDKVNWQKLARKMQSRIASTEVDYSRFSIRSFWHRPAVAAAILIIIAGAAAWYLQGKSVQQRVIASTFQHDIAPGTDGAILTLANGKRIILDSAGNGQLAREGNTRITKKDGVLAYTTGNGETTIPSLNTLSTPRARQFKISLPDGTKAWLNAASSITYPTAFTGKDRRVNITGEVYFEVAHNAAMPFKVSVNDATIEVLGTNFNVNGYTNEAVMKTTLLEGSVKITKGAGTVIIKPGEQASISNAETEIALKGPKTGNPIRVLSGADIEQVMAWKNGEFTFNNASIESILQQAARWYDVDVVMEAGIREVFTVNVSRDVPISKLLKSMEVSGGVHFDIDGRTIRVRP